MQFRFKALIVFSAVLALLLLSFILGERWGTSTPSRPKGVPENAAFLRYPYTGFPGPPRGKWMFCWLDGVQVRCKLVSKNGQMLFEGQFLPADTNGQIAPGELTIDPDKTSDEKSLWTGHVHVPLVKLRNGGILIPAFGYEEGRKLLNSGGAGGPVKEIWVARSSPILA